jgi:hypothetical protein
MVQKGLALTFSWRLPYGNVWRCRRHLLPSGRRRKVALSRTREVVVIKAPRSVLLSTLLSAAATTSVIAAGLPPTKQLGGPASEFAQMAPANPADSAIESKSLLLPVELTAGADGRYAWLGKLPIEADSARLIVLNNGARDWTLSLQAPNARSSSAAHRIAQQVNATQYGLGDSQYAAEYYAFEQMERGAWTVQIEADSASQQRGFILLEGGGPARLRSQQVAFNQTLGQQIAFQASAYNVDGSGLAMSGGLRIAVASMQVTSPSGRSSIATMHDDGRHQDGRAGDGIFGGSFLASEAGDYTVQVRIEGLGVDGVAYARSAEHLVPVIAADLSLAASTATGKALDDRRISIDIPLGSRQPLSHYRAYAEIWANNGSRSQPVSWVSGMTELRNGRMTLGFDARWLALSGANGALELRNLRIEDPDHFISVLTVPALKLSLDRLPRGASESVQAVDEAMRFGPRPAGMQTEGVGRRLLLVHGYCSGNVWAASPASSEPHRYSRI